VDDDEGGSQAVMSPPRANTIGKKVELEPSSAAYKTNPGGVTSADAGEDWASAHAGVSKPASGSGIRSTGLFGLIGW